MKTALRSFAKTSHVWIGFSLGLLFCLMGLSGSILVYRDTIEAALRPRWVVSRHASRAVPPSETAGDIRLRWPGAVIDRIEFPRVAGDPFEYRVRVRGRILHVFTDASSGEVLGNFELPWLDLIANFHQNLLMPPAGRQWTGVIGIALFLSSLSGLLIWLLRNPAWKDFVRLRRGSWNRLNLDLHRSAGLFSGAFLLLLSFTGICLAFPNIFQAFAERPARVSVAPSAGSQPLDIYIRNAVAAVPGAVVRELRFPQSEDRPITVRLWLPSDFRPDGSNQVSLEPATGRVRQIDAAANWSPARRISSIPTPVHYAEWGGAVVKLLWCITGITPSVLFVSGFFFWSAGYRARRRAAAIRTKDAEGTLAYR